MKAVLFSMNQERLIGETNKGDAIERKS